MSHIFKILKMLFLLQITWYGHVTHAYWLGRYPLPKVMSLKKRVHVHKLEPLYLFCGITVLSGVIWGRGGSNHYFDTTFIAH